MWKRKSRPFHEIYAEVKQLLHGTAPDLLEEFNKFSSSAARVKPEIAEGAVEDLAPTQARKDRRILLRGAEPTLELIVNGIGHLPTMITTLNMKHTFQLQCHIEVIVYKEPEVVAGLAGRHKVSRYHDTQKAIIEGIEVKNRLSCKLLLEENFRIPIGKLSKRKHEGLWWEQCSQTDHETEFVIYGQNSEQHARLVHYLFPACRSQLEGEILDIHATGLLSFGTPLQCEAPQYWAMSLSMPSGKVYETPCVLEICVKWQKPSTLMKTIFASELQLQTPVSPSPEPSASIYVAGAVIPTYSEQSVCSDVAEDLLPSASKVPSIVQSKAVNAISVNYWKDLTIPSPALSPDRQNAQPSPPEETVVDLMQKDLLESMIIDCQQPIQDNLGMLDALCGPASPMSALPLSHLTSSEVVEKSNEVVENTLSSIDAKTIAKNFKGQEKLSIVEIVDRADSWLASVEKNLRPVKQREVLSGKLMKISEVSEKQELNNVVIEPDSHNAKRQKTTHDSTKEVGDTVKKYETTECTIAVTPKMDAVDGSIQLTDQTGKQEAECLEIATTKKNLTNEQAQLILLQTQTQSRIDEPTSTEAHISNIETDDQVLAEVTEPTQTLPKGSQPKMALKSVKEIPETPQSEWPSMTTNPASQTPGLLASTRAQRIRSPRISPSTIPSTPPNFVKPLSAKAHFGIRVQSHSKPPKSPSKSMSISPNKRQRLNPVGSRATSFIPRHEPIPSPPRPIRQKHRVPAVADPDISFYRRVSMRPLEENELLSESEDDVDTTWLSQRHRDSLALNPSLDLKPRRRQFYQRFDAHFDAEGAVTRHAAYLGRMLIRFTQENAVWLKHTEGMMKEFGIEARKMVIEEVVKEEDVGRCFDIVRATNKDIQTDNSRIGRQWAKDAKEKAAWEKGWKGGCPCGKPVEEAELREAVCCASVVRSFFRIIFIQY